MAQLTKELLQEVSTSKFITEQQINLLKRRLNNGEKIDLQFVYDNDISLTQEQTIKGITFLRKQSSIVSSREIEILNNFSYFTFYGFYDNANYYQSKAGIKNYIPLYRVYDNEGDSFEYYYNGKVQIVG